MYIYVPAFFLGEHQMCVPYVGRRNFFRPFLTSLLTLDSFHKSFCHILLVIFSWEWCYVHVGVCILPKGASDVLSVGCLYMGGQCK